MELEARELSAGYDETAIIKDLDLQIQPQKITALIGANGCGKSTLLKTICRILSPLGGSVLLDGEAIHKKNSRELAKALAILPQHPSAPGSLTVRELVGYGRAPHLSGLFSKGTAEDTRIIQWALEETNMAQLADMPIDTLSGGQRQRVWIAMAIAQDTDILFLDEPTSFLDVAHQMEVLQLVEHLNRRYQKTFVMVLHELNQAARFADYLIAMKAGQLRFAGTPEEVLTKEMLDDVFGIDAEIMADPRTGRPLCIPYSKKSE